MYEYAGGSQGQATTAAASATASMNCARISRWATWPTAVARAVEVQLSFETAAHAPACHVSEPTRRRAPHATRVSLALAVQASSAAEHVGHVALTTSPTKMCRGTETTWTSRPFYFLFLKRDRSGGESKIERSLGEGASQSVRKDSQEMSAVLVLVSCTSCLGSHLETRSVARRVQNGSDLSLCAVPLPTDAFDQRNEHGVVSRCCAHMRSELHCCG